MEFSPFSPEARSPLDPYRRRPINLRPLTLSIGFDMWSVTLKCPFCSKNHKHGGLYEPKNPTFGQHVADCRRGTYIINPPK